MTEPIKTTDLSTLNFEEAMQELELLVRRLEEGRLPLEEALTAYERGIALKAHCEAKLKSAKLRVDQITFSENGEMGLKPFDTKNDG